MISSLAYLRDRFEPRDWMRPWRDPPGFMSSCCCHDYHAIGGWNFSTSFYADNDSYQEDSWTTRADVSPGIAYCGTASLDGSIYLFGGFVSTGVVGTNSEYTTDSWTSRAAIPSPTRYGPGGMKIGTKCYIIMGNNSSGLRVADTDEYSPPPTDTWANKTDAPAPARQEPGAIEILSKGYSFAGYKAVSGSPPYQLRDTDEYDPGGDSWTSKTDCPTPLRSGVGVFNLDDKAYICGGDDDNNNSINDCDEYSPDTWTSRANMPGTAAQLRGATFESKGYVTGGLSETGGAGSPLSTHYQYVLDTWATKANLPSPARQALAAGTT